MDQQPIDRRRFLARAAVAGAATLAAPAVTAGVAQPSTVRPGPPPMSQAAESEIPPDLEPLTTERSGSDYMVDVIKALGVEFVAANPGSSFRGLHESIINYGGNQQPELLTCCHEESSVAMAHGYAKIDGRPLAVLAHGTVGLQHAAMAIYNAYCDRVPVLILLGNTLDATERRPGAEWAHSVQDAAAMVRDFIKWDDTPQSLGHFAESAVRAWKFALTPPMGPVVLVVDSALQERPLGAEGLPPLPKVVLAVPPQGESGAVAEAARWLVAAEAPVIVADRAVRTPEGWQHLIELAETLQAALVDQGGRLNFPSRHPLNLSADARAVLARADVIVGLEVGDFWGTLHVVRDQLRRSTRSLLRPGARTISIAATDLFMKSNYQDFQRWLGVDLAIAADAEATLPALVGAVRRLVTPDRRRALEERGRKLAALAHATRERLLDEATYGWDASPVSTARLSAELGALIQGEDWSLVSAVSTVSGWPLRLWNFDRPYRYIGGSGGAGVGYGAPAAVGAALANRKYGRLTINIQNDGDLMYAPGVLWTAAHHRIPLLTVMHNNRAYHQEVMHVQRMANRHNRGLDRAWIGTTLDDPPIDYARLAQSMGVYAEGPVTDPRDVGPALRRALGVVRRGEPALVDVVTQPR